MSWLDLKLGLRMLVRYPVLTIVGSASLTLAIAIGAAAFAFISLTINRVVRAIGIVSLAALTLALSGIYAVMSFTVSRRTREIGIRVALGSAPSRVVLTILRRPLIQLAAGIVFGTLLTFAFASMFDERLYFSVGLPGYALVMLGVCLLACIVPARRALGVDPIAALRAD